MRKHFACAANARLLLAEQLFAQQILRSNIIIAARSAAIMLSNIICAANNERSLFLIICAANNCFPNEWP